MPQGYTSFQVCDLTGVSYRQLDYWTRTGLVRPSVHDASGCGSQRRWSQEDVVEVRIVSALRGYGVTCSIIQEALEVWRDSGDCLWIVGDSVRSGSHAELVDDLARHPVVVAVNVSRLNEPGRVPISSRLAVA